MSFVLSSSPEPRSVTADCHPSLSLALLRFLPTKKEFLLSTVTKCLLTGGHLIVGVFSELMLGLYLVV